MREGYIYIYNNNKRVGIRTFVLSFLEMGFCLFGSGGLVWFWFVGLLVGFRRLEPVSWVGKQARR